VIAPEARIEVLAEGFRWAEGPVWRRREGDLIFSDVPANTAYRWSEGRGAEVFLHPSGDTGRNADASGEGSNGLAVDAQGRLLLCQHSDRRVARLAADGRGFETLASASRANGSTVPTTSASIAPGTSSSPIRPTGWARRRPPSSATTASFGSVATAR
jgi:gluconolactonase